MENDSFLPTGRAEIPLGQHEEGANGLHDTAEHGRLQLIFNSQITMKNSKLTIDVILKENSLRVSLSFDGIDPAANSVYSPVIDPMVLLSAFRQGVAGYLYTCNCGEPACSGIYSESAVLHEEGGVIFVLPDPLTFSTEAEHLPEDREYNLHFVDYDRFEFQMKSATQELLKAIKANPRVTIAPHGVASAGLLAVCESILA